MHAVRGGAGARVGMGSVSTGCRGVMARVSPVLVMPAVMVVVPVVLAAVMPRDASAWLAVRVPHTGQRPHPPSQAYLCLTDHRG